MLRLIIGLLCLLTSNVLIAKAVTTDEIPDYLKPKTMEQVIEDKAHKYNVSSKLIYDIIMCESTGNRYAVGDGGHSRGLVQIYDDFHPTVTHEQAFDIEFSVEFLAKNLSQGKGNLWSCYRIVKNR